MSIAACALTYAGLVALSLSMSRHHQAVFGQAPARRRRRLGRLAGWSLAGAGAAASVAAWGPSVGVVALCGIVTGASVALVLLLTYAPGLVPRTGRAAVVAAMGSLIVAAARYLSSRPL